MQDKKVENIVMLFLVINIIWIVYREENTTIGPFIFNIIFCIVALYCEWREKNEKRNNFM